MTNTSTTPDFILNAIEKGEALFAEKLAKELAEKETANAALSEARKEQNEKSMSWIQGVLPNVITTLTSQNTRRLVIGSLPNGDLPEIEILTRVRLLKSMGMKVEEIDSASNEYNIAPGNKAYVLKW